MKSWHFHITDKLMIQADVRDNPAFLDYEQHMLFSELPKLRHYNFYDRSYDNSGRNLRFEGIHVNRQQKWSNLGNKELTNSRCLKSGIDLKKKKITKTINFSCIELTLKFHTIFSRKNTISMKPTSYKFTFVPGNILRYRYLA